MKTASNAWTYTFTYDALGRKLSEAQPGANVSYQYDAAGNKTAMTWINGFYATYAYDAYNEVTGISENGTYNLASFSYDNLGRRTSVTHPNNTSTGYSYDGGSRLWVEQLTLPSGSEEVTLQHNPANQITLRSSTNNSYQFANVWNPTRGYTSDGLNRLTSSDGAALSYDGRGNLSVDQNGTSYGYDPLNNLVSTSNSIGLGYDPLGRLQVIGVNGVNTQFIYDGDQIIAELDGPFHPVRWYVDGPGEDQPMVWYEGWNTGDRRFLLADERGSIVSVTNGSGQVMATNTYDEYGLPGSGNLGRFQYTGQAWIPELGLYHYKARAYSPSLGRFMQPDPSGYGDGLNLYAYVHNDPVNGIDPTGLEECTDCVSEVVVTKHRDDDDDDDDDDGGQLPVSVSEVVVTAKKPSHDYSLIDQVAPPGCYPSAAALRGLTARFAIPGQNPNNPIRNGQRTNARVGPFSGPIVTFIQGTTSVNVTLPGHIFYYGSVTRTTSVGPDGAVYVSTHGKGSNSSDAIAEFNQEVGPLIFEDLDSQEADYISHNAICIQ